jgi:hypothetical protein
MQKEKAEGKHERNENIENQNEQDSQKFLN